MDANVTSMLLAILRQVIWKSTINAYRPAAIHQIKRQDLEMESKEKASPSPCRTHVLKNIGIDQVAWLEPKKSHQFT